MLSGKSENELVPKFRVIFALKLYFLQFKQRETNQLAHIQESW
jgi:hypothetical protein